MNDGFDFAEPFSDSVFELLEAESSSCGVALIKAGLIGDGFGSSLNFLVFNVSLRVGFTAVSSR